MTPDLPANDIESAESGGEVGAVRDVDTLGASAALGVGEPAAIPVGKRALPPNSGSGSSGKHPLPSPWPQRAVSQPFAEAEDVTAVPSVTPDNWLPEPEYWLADHQRIPRPPTRPLARPARFRRMSRMQSAILAAAILVGVILIGAGMVVAGHTSYEFFNAPRSVPTTHPADATPTLPATKPTTKP